jgi:hypothetical protein
VSEILTYESPSTMAPMIKAARSICERDQVVIWREPFRWKSPAGHVISNAYESFSAAGICEERHWGLVHDFNHLAVVQVQPDHEFIAQQAKAIESGKL